MTKYIGKTKFLNKDMKLCYKTIARKFFVTEIMVKENKFLMTI